MEQQSIFAMDEHNNLSAGKGKVDLQYHAMILVNAVKI
jgi:hypothetical protein